MNEREAFEAEYSKGGFGIAGCDLSKHADGSYINDDAFSAFFWFKAGLASQAQQESQWISVEERLPEEGITVLVVTNFGDVYTCRLPVIIAKNSKEESPVGKRERFTHWMPLPLPPAPEGGE